MDCTHPRSRNAKRCRACQLAHINSDPAIRDRHRAGIKAHWQKPEAQLRGRESQRRLMAQRMADPAQVEAMREHGRRQYRERLDTPEVRAKNTSPEVRARAGKKRTATTLADIPPQLREEYRRLLHQARMPAAEAKRIILDQFKTDIARASGK